MFSVVLWRDFEWFPDTLVSPPGLEEEVKYDRHEGVDESIFRIKTILESSKEGKGSGCYIIICPVNAV